MPFILLITVLIVNMLICTCAVYQLNNYAALIELKTHILRMMYYKQRDPAEELWLNSSSDNDRHLWSIVGLRLDERPGNNAMLAADIIHRHR
jgi:hypothetical protein